jgi:aminoglycoside phosphotransferase (APT) family kinase protein
MSVMGGTWRPEHGWLPALVPARAERFRVRDPGLAATLADSGAVLTAGSSDIEIVPAAELTGDASCAVVDIRTPAAEGANLVGRVARRARGSIAARVGGRRAARALGQLGYQSVFACFWDPDGRPSLTLPETGPGRPPHRLAGRLPLAALVVGRRPEATPTLLQSSAVAAREASAFAPRLAPPIVGLSGVLLVLGDQGVLRVVPRAAGEHLDGPRDALERLRLLEPEPVVQDRVPWTVASGQVGIGQWTLEPRLPGSHPSELTDRLRGECLDFLVSLHAAGAGAPETAPSLAESAEIVARVCPGADAGRVLALGRRASRELDHVPRGFAHGDFWQGNLLADGGRLTGVIDWAGAGEGRLPLLDLLHLVANSERAAGSWSLGRAIVERLLPMTRGGGDEMVRTYCRRIGIDPEPGLLTAFVAAYWLSYVGWSIWSYADRASRPAWLEENVHAVLRAGPWD